MLFESHFFYMSKIGHLFMYVRDFCCFSFDELVVDIFCPFSYGLLEFFFAVKNFLSITDFSLARMIFVANTWCVF